MNFLELKNCPRCKVSFDCKADEISKCKCSTLKLTTEQKTYIKARYEDCLCYTCLVQILENDDSNVNTCK